MKPSSASLWVVTLCLAAASSSLLARPQMHQFQSLTPSSSDSQQSRWVQHLNAMDEAERQRRVHTYGMPPAPPNRWAHRSQAAHRPAQPATPVRRATAVPVAARPTSTPAALPRSLYQSGASPARPATRPTVARPVASPPVTKPRVVGAQVKRTSPSPRSIGATSSRTSRARTSQAKSRPSLPKLNFRNPFSRKRSAPAEAAPVAPPERSTPPLDVRPANPAPKPTPILFKRETTPSARAQSSPGEDEARRKLAFMPKSRQATRSNPWAPYKTKAEYQRALKQSEWQPRGPQAERLKRLSAQKQAKPKRSWNLGSLFKRKSSPEKESRSLFKRSSSKRTNPMTSKMSKGSYVTSGLPQGQSSGVMIETALFGR